MASLRVPRSFVIHPLATDQDTLHVFVSLRGARVSLSVKKKILHRRFLLTLDVALTG